MTILLPKSALIQPSTSRLKILILCKTAVHFGGGRLEVEQRVVAVALAGSELREAQQAVADAEVLDPAHAGLKRAGLAGEKHLS